jgi:hypothetical protein
MLVRVREPAMPGQNCEEAMAVEICGGDLEVWESNLADVIDDFLGRFAGMTAGQNPLLKGLPPSAGQYLVYKAREIGDVGPDPSIVLGICRSESSMATNPHLNGGIYNIYGNSYHFSVFAGTNKKTNYPIYTSYASATDDVFALLQTTYISKVLITTDALYKAYEGEASWQQNVPMIKGVQTKLTGNPADVRFRFDAARKAALAKLAGQIKK